MIISIQFTFVSPKSNPYFHFLFAACTHSSPTLLPHPCALIAAHRSLVLPLHQHHSLPLAAHRSPLLPLPFTLLRISSAAIVLIINLLPIILCCHSRRQSPCFVVILIDPLVSSSSATIILVVDLLLLLLICCCHYRSVIADLLPSLILLSCLPCQGPKLRRLPYRTSPALPASPGYNLGLSRAQAKCVAAAAARNVNTYGQKEEGPSRWQERKEAKRQMYPMSTEKAIMKLGERKDLKSSMSSYGGAAAQCQNPTAPMRMKLSVSCELDNPGIPKAERGGKSSSSKSKRNPSSVAFYRRSLPLSSVTCRGPLALPLSPA
ncbi:hypothetical protein ACLOJK_015037 [Asimina triloba]